MKISLVQAPFWSIDTPSYAVALLTGNLRSRGFTVFPKDFDVPFYRAVGDEERALWRHENARFWNEEELVKQMIADHGSAIDALVEQILADEPQLVGFSVKCWSLWFSLAMAQRIKRISPRVRVVFGGPQMSLGSPRGFLEETPAVDAICLREADLSFPRFLEKMEANGDRFAAEPGFLFRDEGGQIVDCGPLQEIPKPAEIPFADYAGYDFSPYIESQAITMELSRGCINRCSYCCEAPSFLRYRAYPAQRVFDEIAYHWDRVSLKKPMRIFFNDSLLNGNMRELERLADLLIAARDRIQVQWGGMMFIRDELTDAMADKLVAAGLNNVLFGLESGSPVVLEKMRKRFKLDTAEKVFQRFHQRGVAVVASVIFGHPGETEAEFYRSLNFLRANADNVDKFLLNYLGLYGDNDIRANPVKYGLDPATLSANDWVSDGGQNTFAIRNQRVNLARATLGAKVPDIGGFFEDGREM
jgi:hypothetical protein